MGHHAGDTYHYHGLGDARYGHRHAFLSIMHNHDREEELRDRIAAKRTDPDYMARLERHVEENREVLDRLARE